MLINSANTSPTVCVNSHCPTNIKRRLFPGYLAIIWKAEVNSEWPCSEAKVIMKVELRTSSFQSQECFPQCPLGCHIRTHSLMPKLFSDFFSYLFSYIVTCIKPKHCACTKCHWTVHYKIVNFELYEFHIDLKWKRLPRLVIYINKMSFSKKIKKTSPNLNK